MSRQLDQFIDDDEEEVCPLCVEELDLTDKGFRPCPCGYQICQFCYNNVKNNMNGLCPACRRPYNDKDIEYTKPTADEMVAHKARQAQKQKKTQAALQKEKQKAEADTLSRKHLAGLRVVQKNLVYVTGLQPTTHEDQLLQTLRGQDYFGQYGKIIKIVVSKAKDLSHPHSVGVYVTFEHKEDAERCIAAVNGSKNQERTLRAQFGTTKYCSAYLRGENCANRNCMFLHEPGEANESYSRADLSALNAGSSQQRPPPQSQQPVASASQPMARQSSSDQPQSPPADRPALPSTASWAARVPQVQPARPESRSTSATFDSPAPSHATPAPSQPEEPEELPTVVQEPMSVEPTSQTAPAQSQPPPAPARRRVISPLAGLVKHFNPDDLRTSFSIEAIPQGIRDIIQNYPPLFDPNGGTRRRVRRLRDEEQRRMEQEAQAFQQPPALDNEDNLELSGSLQLGGEPEDRQTIGQPTSAIQPPGLDSVDQRFQFGGMSSPGVGSDRGFTPQQHQQMLLNTMKTPNAQGSYLNNYNQPTSFQQPNNPPGHQRNASRFSFANESSASTNVKPVANAKLMNQQSSMMPSSANSNHFGAQQQPHNTQFYTSNVQGPPPGIKMTGTPPVSGGMTFGQGHGFATGGLQYGAANTSLNANEERVRSLLRIGGGRDNTTTSNNNTAAAEASKHDADFPPLAAPPSRQQSISLPDSSSRRSTPPVPPGFEQQAAAGSESRRSTPTLPPGLGKPTGLPDLETGPSSSRPASRAGLKKTSQIVPAVPLRVGTPKREATPKREVSLEKGREGRGVEAEVETPTKASKGAVASPEVKETAMVPQAAVPETASKAEADATAPAPAPLTEWLAQEKVMEESKKTMPARKPSQESAPRAFQPSSKGTATVQTSDAQALPEVPTKPESSKAETKKRQPPGKLDIAAAVKGESTAPLSPESTGADTPSSILRSIPSPVDATKSGSPSGSMASPAARPAPKTLRVVPTPKTEASSSASASTPKELNYFIRKPPSRQPSVSSIQLPGTPSSEQISISDNISMTSTSQSRANSPPPSAASKVGRAKTKSQMKKERQERPKVMEEESKAEDPKKAIVSDEPAQEAIVARKKKTRREKEPRAKAKAPVPIHTEESTPTASRAPSPPPQQQVEEVASPAEAAQVEAQLSEPSTPKKIQMGPAPPLQSPHEPSPPPTPTLSAAQLLAELKATAPQIQKCIDSLFRSPSSIHYKPNQNISAKDLANPASWKQEFNLNLTKDEVDALLKSTVPAIRYGGEDHRIWNRGMVTPTGAHLRALTEELELRFLELEKAIRELPEELCFRPSKPQNDMKFPSIDLEALKRQFENAGGRGVNAMEQMVQDGSTMKKGAFLVDEASKYINEFVMPPATPPPSAGTGSVRGGGQVVGGAQSGSGELEVVGPSVDIAERGLNEARRIADERDAALKKIMKKNRKVLGLS